MKNPNRSLEKLESALQLFTDGGDQRGRAECLGELAAVQYRGGNASEALQRALAAAAEFHILGDLGAEGIALFWAATAAGASKPEEERELWNRASVLLAAAGKKEHAALAFAALADFHAAAGDTEVAEHEFREAMKFIGNEVGSQGSASIALRMARSLLGGGKAVEAKELAGKVLAFWGGATTLSARLGEADARVVLGDAHSALGNIEDARAAYFAALDFQVRQGRPRAAEVIQSRLNELSVRKA